MASLESQLAIKVSGLPEVGNRPCLLSLDGGGVRGLSSLHILRYIMTKVNENRSGDALVKPCQIFDIIGGTSTGGLIAIMLGTLGMDVDECIKAYDTLFELDVKSAFSSKALRSAVTEIVTKSGRKPDAKFNEGIDHKCKTFVCATSEDTSNTRLLKDYDIPGKPRQNQGMTIVEAAMATSAALSFFDSVEIGDQIYLDGGTGANNPVDRVWNEAQALFGAEDGKIDNVVGCILSIGTGDPGIHSFSKNAWKVLTETLRNLATETEATERRFSSTHSYLTASTPRYFRFNVQQGLQSVGLAEYKEAGKIKTVTEEYMDHRNKELEVLKISEILRAKNSAALPNIKQLVTPRNIELKDFIGRTAELDQLSDACNVNGSADDKPRIVVIRALGGQGKTQLALKYCYQMRGKMPVLWADAQTSKTLKKDLASFAPLLNVSISDNADIDAQVDDTLTTLQDFPTPWLMVFDNCDDPDSFNNIDHLMPSCSHGIIVITTRHENTLKLGGEDFKMSLDSLLEKDAIELLEVTSKGKDRKGHDLSTKKDIVNRLGKHALAVAQAGAYIRDRKISLRDFRQQFEQQKRRVIGDKSEGMNEYRKKLSDNTEVETSMNVFTTFELSYSQLSRRGGGVAYHSADVLTLLAFFESKSVSENLMKSYCEHEDAELNIEDSILKPEASSKPGVFLTHHAKAWDSDDYCDVLILLSKLSLTQPFTRHENNLCIVSLHPLVRDWIRIRTDDINCQKYASFAGTCIYRLLDLTPHPNNFYALSLPKTQELQAHLNIHATDRSGLSSKGLVPVYKTPPRNIGRPELLFGFLTDNNGEYNKCQIGNVPNTKAPYYTHRAILSSQNALACAYQANGQILEAVKLLGN
ncbi:Uncharacterized protein BP5553_01506 [Venustampulla echinocandica]|uniref:PNPLA domain-containing protein n=1 Tax=Venustampulla echinocandica TaxID=2656787 RepID=A0A370U176_9HELO|nr:Uncharacterized protein BP5553_01506 [Venustampulla echinocandica]RDL41527.1 Uncharacterized protein BP5553_01506 [Venustampulla echinocandica]